MARPLVEVTIEGRKLVAILDTGSRRSYIRSAIAKAFPTVPVEPFEAKIAGETVKLKEGRVVAGRVRDSSGRSYRFGDILFAIDNLGRENGTEIDILFGAVTLENWGAVIDESTTPPQVDYRLLRSGELVEL